MYCRFCGNELDENNKICKSCGKERLTEAIKVETNKNVVNVPTKQPKPKQKKAKGIIAIILGVIVILYSIPYFMITLITVPFLAIAGSNPNLIWSIVGFFSGIPAAVGMLALLLSSFEIVQNRNATNIIGLVLSIISLMAILIVTALFFMF